MMTGINNVLKKISLANPRTSGQLTICPFKNK